jgi:hypothetical protein
VEGGRGALPPQSIAGEGRQGEAAAMVGGPGRSLACLRAAFGPFSLCRRGLESGLKSVALRFTGSFRASEAGLFLREMFSCPDVQAALQLSSMTEGVGAAASSESIPATTVQSVEFEELRCSVLSMSFFNRLSNGKLAAACDVGAAPFDA